VKEKENMQGKVKANAKEHGNKTKGRKRNTGK
jgi:hypothetical protein